MIKPITPDSAKSKTDKISKITNSITVEYCSTAEWSHFMVMSVESKVRKLCITKGFILDAKGLILK